MSRFIGFLLFFLCTSQRFAQQQISPNAAIGDLNGDGKPDVVVANGTLNNIGVFLNTGAGALGAGTFIGLGADADAVRLADFNSDGHLDVLVYGQNPLTLKLFAGDGTGRFAAPVDVLPASLVASAAPIVADFNGDGIPDVAFAAGGLHPTVALMFGNGHGGFSAPLNSVVALDTTAIVSLLVTDANSDGKRDLVINTARLGVTNAYLALGDGTGSFKMVQLSGKQVLAIGDFNGDTNPDFLVGAGIGDTHIDIAFGDGQGGILYEQLNPVILSSPLASNLFAIDIDGDSKTDLLSGPYFPGNGHGGFGDPINLLTGAPAGSVIGIADLNGDGKPDFVILANGSTSAFSVLNTVSAPPSIVASTQTSVAASAVTTSVGTTITLLAKVISTGGIPVGSVTFTEGATTLGSAPVDPFGWAALNTSFTTGGLHSNINASFTGALDPTTNTTFANSSSSPFSTSVSVNNTPPTAAAPTVTLIALLNPVRQKSSDFVRSTVTGVSGIPTGEVVLTLDGQVFDLIQTSQLALEIFPDAGLHNLQAVYGGDGTFPPATSATLVEDVRAFNAPRTASSTQISVTPGPNGGINLNSTVSGSSTPTGTVIYRINGAFFTAVPPGLPVFFDTGSGTYDVSAEYAGDAVLAPSSASATIKAGQSAAFTFTVTPSGGFASPVNFSCSGLPAGASCTFSPASITPNGASVTSTLTITTTAPQSATLTVSRLRPGSYSWPLAATFAFGLLLIGKTGKRRESKKVARVSATLMFLLLLASCGGGSGTSTPPVTNSTPQGTSTVTVTASSAVTHTVPLTVTVQ